MEEKKPLVSILLPVSNSSAYLVDCVESLLSQSYENLEIIAIDDFSRDDSYKILRQFRKKDKRIRTYKNKKKYGLCVTLNRCARRAKGEFIAFTRANDVNFKFRIKKQVDFLLSNPKTAAIGVQCVYLDKKGKRLGTSTFPTEHDHIYHSLFSTSTTQFVTLMINNNILPKDILKFHSNSYPYVYMEILTKILKFGELSNTPEKLYYYRKMQAEYLRSARGVFSSLKLLTKSIFLYEYRPSIRLFFKPLKEKSLPQIPRLILKLSTIF